MGVSVRHSYSDGTVRATDTQNRHKMCLEFEAKRRAGGGLAGDGQAIARRQDAMAGKQGSRAESM